MPRHADLRSFLKWSYSGNVDQTQAVFKGTLYEYVVQRALQLRLGPRGLQDLTVVAGPADSGIDILGSWNGHNHALQVAVQCKSSLSKIPPQLWREMAGVHMQLSSPSVVTVASPLPMTAKARSVFSGISVPYIHCQVKYVWPTWDANKERPDCSVTAATVQRIAVNPAASDILTDAGISLPLSLGIPKL